jgi:hypothetical protein
MKPLLSSPVHSFFTLVTRRQDCTDYGPGLSREPLYYASYCNHSADVPLLPPSSSSTGKCADKRYTSLLSPEGRGIVALYGKPGGFVLRRGCPQRPSLRTRSHRDAVPFTAYAQGRACEALS